MRTINSNAEAAREHARRPDGRFGEQHRDEVEFEDSQATVYSTRNDCVAREIVAPLGEYAWSFDVDAIANEAVAWDADRHGFHLAASSEEFWEIARRHDSGDATAFATDWAAEHGLSTETVDDMLYLMDANGNRMPLGIGYKDSGFTADELSDWLEQRCSTVGLLF